MGPQSPSPRVATLQLYVSAVSKSLQNSGSVTTDTVEMVAFSEIQKIAELIQKAQMLHAKYVAIGAAFEVNVSWQVRKRAMETLASLEAMNVDDMRGTDLLK